MLPAELLYDLRRDPDCVNNLASDSALAKVKNELSERMTAELKQQEDPRMFGRGEVFDKYPSASKPGFYDRYLRGEKPKAGWADPDDAEPNPIEPTP